MSIELNHTIVWATDREASAGFLAGILGIPLGPVAGPFRQVQVANGVTLDFANAGEVLIQHYAFLVGDDEFGVISGRLRDRGVATYADPGHRRPGHNTNDGGQGAYFDSPEGHNLEILTRPYGSGG
jgi:catechol 2,3-dioxygenase-like lactoylglutathione lyase family enzyme